MCFARATLALLLPLSAAAAAQPGPPGVVVAHSPASSRQYIGSPGLAVLPGGEYVASHDLFGPGGTADRTRVFASSDRGQTWAPRAEIVGQWWSSLFVHRGDLYLLGTSRENGFCVIRRSTDGGRTWSEPRDGQSGLLLGDGRYHCAPVPVVEHEGRLWRAMEDAMGPGGWGQHFHTFMLSVPADADLLDAANWTFSNRILGNPRWLEGNFRGWLEGNAVVSPAGRIVNILRVDAPLDDEQAAIVEISPDGRQATFDPERGFVPLPGGAKKFSIRPDPRGGGYWTLANYVPPEQRRGLPAKTRNTLALVHSTDLRSWQVQAILLAHPDPERHGFQYVDWLYDGGDLIALVRTAYDDGQGGAHNQHDANYLTFHRFANFRELRAR
ncbi:MAG: sialidase family protein [Pirellulales bacterium]